MKTIIKETTFGATSKGNSQALLMCLSSVLMGEVLPERILLRFEGEFPNFGNFYFEQLSALATFHGVEFQMSVGSSKGIRHAKQWLLQECRTKYLWMGDDDVIYEPDCLKQFSDVSLINWKKCAFIAGCKYDVNNRRGYKDFQLKPTEVTWDLVNSSLDEYCSQNYPYFCSASGILGYHVLHKIFDAGNVFLNAELLNQHNLTFTLDEPDVPCTGEDTLMALKIDQAKFYGYFAPFAQGVHLEKPVSNFESGADREEMLLRVCDAKGYNHEIVEKALHSWIKVSKP